MSSFETVLPKTGELVAGKTTSFMVREEQINAGGKSFHAIVYENMNTGDKVAIDAKSGHVYTATRGLLDFPRRIGVRYWSNNFCISSILRKKSTRKLKGFSVEMNEYEGLNRLPVERREAVLPVVVGGQACGEETSTLEMLEYLNSIPHVSASLLVETGSLTALA